MKAEPVQVEDFLAIVHAATCHRHQRRELGLVARGADMLEDDITAVTARSELDLRGAQATRRLPHEHYRRTLPTGGVCQSRRTQPRDLRKRRRYPRPQLKWHESGPRLGPNQSSTVGPNGLVILK